MRQAQQEVEEDPQREAAFSAIEPIDVSMVHATPRGETPIERGGTSSRVAFFEQLRVLSA